jgi:hypothetical protein
MANDIAIPKEDIITQLRDTFDLNAPSVTMAVATVG